MTDARRIVDGMSTQENLGGVPTWTLGWRLKRALSWGEVGAGEMAEYLGYSKAQISRYLNDKGEAPRPAILKQWAMRCGVPLAWLEDGEVDLRGPNPAPGLEIPTSGCKGVGRGQVIALRQRVLVDAADLAHTG
jgi:transcriptional regulator with XRE-family HTH domain